MVDAASIATSRRRRRAKTDRIDGEALVRALLAYKRGEPRVCAMVRAPTPEDEDSRRFYRKRKTLTVERIQHINRIKGLLFSQGVSGYEPLRRDRRQRLDELKTGDGRPLPPLSGAIFGLRISNFASKKPSNFRISTKNILTFDGLVSPLELQAGLSGIGVNFAPVGSSHPEQC